MPISYTEQVQLTCPACGAPLAAEVWALVDAGERSDLAEALREGVLNNVVCQQCGQQWPASTPLLFHDPANRRVYFAVPPDVEEHRWREQAQSLLYALVGSLPEAGRRPYLGDVQVEHELAGVRRAVLRRARARAALAPAAASVVPMPADLPDPVARSEPAPLFVAMRKLLAANSKAEFAQVVEAHPELLSAQADPAIHELIEQAYNHADRDLAEALRTARVTLARMRAGGEGGEPSVDGSMAAAASAGVAPSAEIGSQSLRLPDPAYQALLHAGTPNELVAAARDYPALLEGWAEADLVARIEAALDEGNERLARSIETLREALAELRTGASGQESLLAGARALMGATNDDAIADVLAEYPILLTDAAQEALFGLATGARASGDPALAEYAVACRAMLRTIRAGLEQS